MFFNQNKKLNDIKQKFKGSLLILRRYPKNGRKFSDELRSSSPRLKLVKYCSNKFREKYKKKIFKNKNLEFLNKGAYGMIYSANDVVIKTIKFRNNEVKSSYQKYVWMKRILNEVFISQYLRQMNSQGSLGCVDILQPKDIANFNSVHLIIKKMDFSLRDMCREFSFQQKLLPRLLYKLTFSILEFHLLGILHLDVKPENIMINIGKEDCDLKLIDFGLSCPDDNLNDSRRELLQTLWYRAPELLLWNQRQNVTSKKLDSWSLGCIFLELYRNDPIFPYYDVNKALNGISMFVTGNGLQEVKKKFKIPDDSIDLISKLLVINQYERISIQDAFKHKYFDGYRDAKSENRIKELQKKEINVDFQIDFEMFKSGRNLKKTLQQMKEFLYEKVMKETTKKL